MNNILYEFPLRPGYPQWTENYEIQKAMKIVSVECKKGQVIDVPVMEGAGIP